MSEAIESQACACEKCAEVVKRLADEAARGVPLPDGFLGVPARVISSAFDGVHELRVVECVFPDGHRAPYAVVDERHEGEPVRTRLMAISTLVHLAYNVGDDEVWAIGNRDPEQPVHSDDLAVDRFAAAMKAKLAKKRAEGRSGWDDPEQCEVEFLAEALVGHIPKGDPIDVANFAMMLHQRGALPGWLCGAFERALERAGLQGRRAEQRAIEKAKCPPVVVVDGVVYEPRGVR